MIVYHAGALIALEKRQGLMIALHDGILRRAQPVAIPASVVAQVWRGGPRQHQLASAVKWAQIAALDDEHSRAVGRLLGETGTSDVVDAHVIVVARALHADLIITSDPDDLAVLDPTLPLQVV